MQLIVVNLWSKDDDKQRRLLSIIEYAIKLPLLILHGTTDKVTKPGGSEYFMKHASSTGKQLKLYEGHYHDLINDKYHAIVVRDIAGWLNKWV